MIPENRFELGSGPFGARTYQIDGVRWIDGADLFCIITVEGVDYLGDQTGRLILGCVRCGATHHREVDNFFGDQPHADPAWHRCFTPLDGYTAVGESMGRKGACGMHMSPIRMVKLSGWHEFWRMLDACDVVATFLWRMAR